jgi:hypothetical protein
MSLSSRVKTFFNFMYAITPGYETKMLKQSAEDASEMFKQQLENSKALRSELQYLYNIFRIRNKCIYEIKHLSATDALLFTTTNETGGFHIVIYHPAKRIEMAEIYVVITENALVIDDISIEYRLCDQGFGILLHKELVAKAHELDLSFISGRFDAAADMDLEQVAQFYRDAGFSVVVEPQLRRGKLSHDIKIENPDELQGNT